MLLTIFPLIMCGIGSSEELDHGDSSFRKNETVNIVCITAGSLWFGVILKILFMSCRGPGRRPSLRSTRLCGWWVLAPLCWYWTEKKGKTPHSLQQWWSHGISSSVSSHSNCGNISNASRRKRRMKSPRGSHLSTLLQAAAMVQSTNMFRCKMKGKKKVKKLNQAGKSDLNREIQHRIFCVTTDILSYNFHVWIYLLNA